MKYYEIDGNPSSLIQQVRRNSDGSTLVQDVVPLFTTTSAGLMPVLPIQYVGIGHQYLIDSGCLVLPDWRKPNPPKIKFIPNWRVWDTNSQPAVAPK